MRQNRHPHEVRPITITPGYSRHAEGSALVAWGHNKVLATLTIENKLPPHLRMKGKQKEGWLTAEYSLLPRSTGERSQRERLYAGGRTQEIQRLIGRALRSVTNLGLFTNQTLTLDIDVIEADGGTRCAGIVGAYAALHDGATRLIKAGKLSEWPLTHELGAVSVGVVNGVQLVDLEYSEDVVAEVDLNVVATSDGYLVEVQGGGEGKPVRADTYVHLVAAGIGAVQDILAAVRAALK
ncbi:MAG: ribonuclease PH [Deinococcota bacterium]|jgi:ribonuclease PH|nr:ribonuclease PH [Deinococcota bacterium]